MAGARPGNEPIELPYNSLECSNKSQNNDVNDWSCVVKAEKLHNRSRSRTGFQHGPGTNTLPALEGGSPFGMAGWVATTSAPRCPALHN
jgi:hypothetical protein